MKIFFRSKKYSDHTNQFLSFYKISRICFFLFALLPVSFALGQVAVQTPNSITAPIPTSRAVEPTVSVNSAALSSDAGQAQPTASVNSSQKVIQTTAITPIQSNSVSNQSGSSTKSRALSNEQQARYQAALQECASQNNASISDVADSVTVTQNSNNLASGAASQSAQSAVPSPRVSVEGSPASLKNCLQSRGF